MQTQLYQIYSQIKNTKKAIHQENKKICLIAVSKNFPKEAILPLIKDRHMDFGENRLQEAKEKYLDLKKQYPDLKLHFIGSLQSNKVAEVVSLFDVIHTLDREKIANLISKEEKKQNKKIPCFIQVNIGNEPQKAGISTKEIKYFLDICCNKYKLKILGFMVIPPHHENPGPYFSYMQELQKKYHLPSLSMGMSNDFETAITFGADYIRVGTKIFGVR